MTEWEAIKIVAEESVQRFPIRVTCYDYCEAKKIVIELAKKQMESNDND